MHSCKKVQLLEQIKWRKKVKNQKKRRKKITKKLRLNRLKTERKTSLAEQKKTNGKKVANWKQPKPNRQTNLI
jgi:hypothetical protein